MKFLVAALAAITVSMGCIVIHDLRPPCWTEIPAHEIDCDRECFMHTVGSSGDYADCVVRFCKAQTVCK